MTARRGGNPDQKSADWILTRQNALTVMCPESGCHQPVGEECRNVHTGRPLLDQAAHWRRIAEAGRKA